MDDEDDKDKHDEDDDDDKDDEDDEDHEQEEDERSFLKPFQHGSHGYHPLVGFAIYFNPPQCARRYGYCRRTLQYTVKPWETVGNRWKPLWKL